MAIPPNQLHPDVMIAINIPGFTSLRLAHLVLDYNGTIAVDGHLIPGVADAFHSLHPDIQIHVITADTFGIAAAQLADLPVTLTIIPQSDQAQEKKCYVHQLGADSVIAVGNGRNDRDMLKSAAVGIALVQAEGGAAEAIMAADLVCTNILDALALLQHSKRLIATLRA